MVYLETMAGLVLEKWRSFCNAKLLAGRALPVVMARSFSALVSALVSVLCMLSFNANAQSVNVQLLTDTSDAPLAIQLVADEQSLVVTLHNTSSTPVAFLPWGTPFGDVDADVLRIRDTEVLPSLNYELVYNGLLLKRGDPRARNFITLDAGESLSTRITPADHYAIDIASTYQITYQGDISYTSSIEILADPSSVIKQLSSRPLLSNTVVLKLDVPPEVRAAVAPAFAACSASQQADLQSALLSAETIARNASIALGSLDIGQRSSSPRYSRWFGAYSETRFNIVNSGFVNIRSVLENNQIDFICGCLRDGTFAFVNRARPFEINLCPAFWPASETGTDSRAGTIVHELSHFNEIVGTGDFEYGQADTVILAADDPDQAVFNADNYEYFAENTPTLPITGNDSGTGVAVLPLDVEQIGSLGEQQSRFYTVSGASSVDLISVGGDADLFIYRALDDQVPFCQSTTTATVDSCVIDDLPTAFVRVYGYNASEYRLLARSGLVVVGQGGNSGSDDNGGSVSISLLILAVGVCCFHRLRRRSSTLNRVAESDY